jgi:hypothetical protein
VKAEAHRVHAQGLSCPEIAERLSVRFPVVKSWLWDTAEKQRAHRQARRKRAQKRGESLLPDLLPNAVERAGTGHHDDPPASAAKPRVRPISNTRRHGATRAKRVSGSGSLGSNPSPAACRTRWKTAGFLVLGAGYSVASGRFS